MDSNLVTVCGSGVFRALRAEDMGLRIVQHSLSKRDTTNFTAHAWMQGTAPTAFLVSMNAICQSDRQ